MRESALHQDIHTVLRASFEDVNQTSIQRYNQLDQLAAQEEPPENGKSYELYRETYVADLASLSGEASAQLGHEGREYRNARHEAELFIDQHGLTRRPPYRFVVATLWLCVFGSMLGETVFTSPIYAPAVGWVEAIFLGAIISIGVTAPAAGIGSGIIMARHRLNHFVRISGMVIASTCTLTVMMVLLVGTHFRSVVADRPALIRHPGEFAHALWQSFAANPFGHLIELANWGLLAAGAVAAFLVAKEVFKTYGYVGWRPVACREEAALKAIRIIEQEAKSKAGGHRRAQVHSMNLEAKEAARSRKAIKQIQGLDVVILSARTKALQRIDVEATRVWRLLPRATSTGRGSPVDLSTWNLPAPDRSSFHAGTERSLLLYQQFIEARPAAMAGLSALYAAFCASLDRAVNRAMYGSPRPDSPVLDGPEGRS